MSRQILPFTVMSRPRRTMVEWATPEQRALMDSFIADLQILVLERPMAFTVLAEQAATLAAPIRDRLHRQRLAGS